MEQSEDWKQRNMVFRQWMLGYFKKQTNLSVDDMQEELNGLGEKLETGAPTTQFLGPLKALNRFYECQLGEMKSFDKFSHKQKENIDLISGWVSDVKALIKALTK